MLYCTATLQNGHVDTDQAVTNRIVAPFPESF